MALPTRGPDQPAAILACEERAPYLGPRSLVLRRGGPCHCRQSLGPVSGIYQVPGRTWVVEHVRGPDEAPLLRKTRVLVSPASAQGQTPHNGV